MLLVHLHLVAQGLPLICFLNISVGFLSGLHRITHRTCHFETSALMQIVIVLISGHIKLVRKQKHTLHLM